MKKIIVLAGGVLILTSTIVTQAGNPLGAKASRLVAMNLMIALQQSSSEKYKTLLPSIEEFQQQMEEHSNLDGSNLLGAQEVLANVYSQDLLPAVGHAFDNVIEEGKKNGIDWSGVQFINYEYEPSAHKRGVGTFSILLSSNGKHYKIQIEKALIFNGQLKLSKHISLI
jgi:hypothetical protein